MNAFVIHSFEAAANGAPACYTTLNTNGKGYGTCAPDKHQPCAARSEFLLFYAKYSHAIILGMARIFVCRLVPFVSCFSEVFPATPSLASLSSRRDVLCGQLQCLDKRSKPVVDYGKSYTKITLDSGEQCR